MTVKKRPDKGQTEQLAEPHQLQSGSDLENVMAAYSRITMFSLEMLLRLAHELTNPPEKKS